MQKRSAIWTTSKDKILELLQEEKTLSGVINRLSLCARGSTNHRRLKQRLNADQINWREIIYKQGENPKVLAALRSKKSTALELEDILVVNSSYSNKALLKKRLLEVNILEYKCYCCELLEWQGKPISLQLDHINGIYDDNRKENLRLLCPNCHSQTSNYAGRNKKVPKKQKIKKQNYQKRKVERPSKEELTKMLWDMPTTQIAKKYKVSDKAVSKWAYYYGISKPSRGYWSKNR